MFQALMQKAQGAVDAVVGKVLTRAAVAIPIVIAAGFGIAALTVKLSQAYGPALSYTMMAGLFVAISGLTAVVSPAVNRKPCRCQRKRPQRLQKMSPRSPGRSSIEIRSCLC